MNQRNEDQTRPMSEVERDFIARNRDFYASLKKAEPVREAEFVPAAYAPVPGHDYDIDGNTWPGSRLARIEAAVMSLTPMVSNETHAWNLWNYIASDRGAIREALEESWRNNPIPKPASQDAGHSNGSGS